MAPLVAAAPLLGLAGGAVSAGGAVLGGIAQGNASSYQAAVARNNAITANQNATYAEEAGYAQADATARKGAAQSGKIKTAQAANNIDVNTGSASRVQAGQRETNVLNTETVLNNAELSAYGYRTQATGFTAQAGLEQQEAEEAPIGGALNATGDLLSSASSVGFKYGGGGGGTPAYSAFNSGSPTY